MDAAEAVLSGLLLFTAAANAALTERVAWTSAAARAAGAAAGERAALAAEAPPLLQRIHLRGSGNPALMARMRALAEEPPVRGRAPERFSLVDLPAAAH